VYQRLNTRTNALKTQLLCTFAHKTDLNIITEYIQTSYEIPEQRIFVFSNIDTPDNLYCTYNAFETQRRGQNTISIHRKKETNTLYTVNALNEVIKKINNGVLDKTYQLDWQRYQNSFILTDDAGYRVINLVFFKKITWN
jgi:hypothetical protein